MLGTAHNCNFALSQLTILFPSQTIALSNADVHSPDLHILQLVTVFAATDDKRTQWLHYVNAVKASNGIDVNGQKGCRSCGTLSCAPLPFAYFLLFGSAIADKLTNIAENQQLLLPFVILEESFADSEIA